MTNEIIYALDTNDIEAVMSAYSDVNGMAMCAPETPLSLALLTMFCVCLTLVMVCYGIYWMGREIREVYRWSRKSKGKTE